MTFAMGLNYEEMIQHQSLDEVLKLITGHLEMQTPEAAPDTERDVEFSYRPTLPSGLTPPTRPSGR